MEQQPEVEKMDTPRTEIHYEDGFWMPDTGRRDVIWGPKDQVVLGWVLVNVPGKYGRPRWEFCVGFGGQKIEAGELIRLGVLQQPRPEGAPAEIVYAEAAPAKGSAALIRHPRAVRLWN